MKKKIWFRILVDAAIIVLVLALLFSWRAVMPVRMPNYIFPEDMGMPREDIVLQTRDGLELKGWLISSEKSSGIIICLHGYPANKSDILTPVSFLYPEYSLLLFDFRAHGESAGRITHFGLKEFLDVEAAIKFIKSRDDLATSRIGIWGYSFGGAVGILSAAKYEEIDALVTDSAFANFPEMVTSFYKNFGFMRHVLSSLSRIFGRVVLKSDFMENSPEYFIGHIQVPVLLIHSEQDGLVPYEHAERLFANAAEPRYLLPVEGEHTGLGRAFTKEYQDKVLEFFSRYLGDLPEKQ